MAVTATARLAGAASTVALFAVVSPLALVVIAGSVVPEGDCATGVPAPAGRWTARQISQLWVAEHGPADQARIAGAVGMAESGGDPNAVGPPTRYGVAVGLMQILGAVLPGDLRDPEVNMRNAVKKYRDAHGWTPWEAFTNGNYLQYMDDQAPVCASVEGTPKRIIDTVVLPMANADGIARTVAENDAANATHGPTKGGGESDHQGPPDVAWAADMSNGVTTPEEDQLAEDLADRFGIPWTGSGLVSVTHGGYRFQLIYRINTAQAGDHYNHVHFGIRRD